MLGVTFTGKFSVSQHVDNLLAACSQLLFALRTIRQHGLPDESLQEAFQAVVINELIQLGRDLPSCRRQKSLGNICTVNLDFRVNVQQLCVMMLIANCSLELPATLNTWCIRPPWTQAPVYTQSLRQHSHNFELPDRTSVLRKTLYNENGV